jgi:hypothetical protein
LFPKPPGWFTTELFGFANVFEPNDWARAVLNEVGFVLLKPELKAGGFDGVLENKFGWGVKPGFWNEDPGVGAGAPPEKPPN